MSDYSATVKAMLTGPNQVWLSSAGEIVDGVRIIEDAILTDDLRARFAEVVDKVPPPPPPPNTDPLETFVVSVNKDGLNIRSTPNTKLRAIGKLYDGNVVVVQSKYPDSASGYTFTLLISVNGLKQSGYVAREFLKPVPPPPAEPVVPNLKGPIIGAHIHPRFNKNLFYPIFAQMVNPFFKILLDPAFGGQPNSAELIAENGGAVVCVRPRTEQWENENGTIRWDQGDLYQRGYNLARDRISPYLSDPAWNQTHLWQIINEPADGPYTASFWTGALDWADQIGVHLVIFCFPVDHPDNLNFFVDPKVAALVRRVHDSNKLVDGRLVGGHAIGLDEYTEPDGSDGVNGAWDSSDMLRHEQVIALLPADLQNTPIYCLEWGITNGKTIDAGKMIAGWELWRSKNRHCYGAAAYYVGDPGAETDAKLDDKVDAMKAFWVKPR